MYIGGKIYPLDTTRLTTVFVHPGKSPLEVLQGIGLTPFELTSFVSSISQSQDSCNVKLAFHDELYGVDQPMAGQVLEIKLEGDSFWIGIIQSIDSSLQSGERSMSLSVRRRDNTPAWRDVRRATDIYPTATPLSYIGRQIAQSLGLTTPEILLPETGSSTVHSNTQLADLTPWQMLETIYQPSGLEPYVDCRGRLKCISRDARRVTDILINDNHRLIEVSGFRSKPALTEMRIKWLDPNLTESAQMNRLLDRASITAGFFQLTQNRDIYFGSDQTQRARDTHMIIRQSANSGLLHFCSEDYEQLTTTMGRVTLRTSIFAPMLAIDSMAGMIASSFIPDGVGSYLTIPIGRLIHAGLEVVVLIIMMCMGTGQYEIWGTPYNYVHARNTTTAYNPAAKPWEIKPQEIENDFVTNDDEAQAFSVRELIYEARSSQTYNIKIVDDTRIERGDIIELKDGSRMYVTGYNRELTNGASAVLSVQGFRIS